ncbi:MAG: RecX family transcriptional regulator [Clostridia bacterium]|nr:RecX family transcriptional regulator [Clostridia bacterium]
MTNNPGERLSSALPLTVTIRSLRAQSGGAEVVLQILLESGEHQEQKTLLLSTEQYYELKPCRGVITEEAYERLEAASQLCNAVRSGENLLSYGSNTVQALARKLVQKGYPREVAVNAARKLENMGLIDESRDVCREVEKCLHKLWGAKRIQSHLWSRGFSAEAMSALPELLAEVDFARNCASLVQKHYGGLPTDADEQRRMTAGLSRYGYSLSEIRAAFQILKKL